MNTNINLMEKETPGKLLIKFGVPAVIGMLINALYSMIDALFISQLGLSQLAGATVAYPIIMLLIGVAGIFSQGANSYISRLIGQKDLKRANQVAALSMVSSIMIATLFTIVGLLTLTSILKLLGASNDVLPYAKAYTSIYLLGSIFTVISITFNNLLRAEGAIKWSMIAMLTSGLINILLDPIFIFALNLGIEGAAIATIIAQGIGVSIFLLFYIQKRNYISISLKNLRFDKAIYLEILKVGIPVFIFQLLSSIGISLINGYATGFGDEALVSVGIITRVFTIGFYVIFGFTKGFQPIAGYLYGAENNKRLLKVIHVAVLYASGFCILFAGIVIAFTKPIVTAFSSNPIVLDITSKGFIAYGLMFSLFGIQMIYTTLFLALGKGREGVIASILRQGICLIPLILLLPMLMGINGVLLAQPIADLLTTIIVVMMVQRLKKELVST